MNAGKYRAGAEPMQIISGTFGKEIIHYQVPPSEQVADEMKKFIRWYTDFQPKNNDLKQCMIKTVIADLYFESIPPFEDGNGRIGRALAEKCLAQSLNKPIF